MCGKCGDTKRRAAVTIEIHDYVISEVMSELAEWFMPGARWAPEARNAGADTVEGEIVVPTPAQAALRGPKGGAR